MATKRRKLFKNRHTSLWGKNKHKKLTAGFGNVSTGKSPNFEHIKTLVVLSKYIEALIECHVFNLPCSYKKWVYVNSK